MNDIYGMQDDLDFDLDILNDYVEDDFLVDVKLDEGIKPEGDYAITDVDEWVSWYYSDVNDISLDNSLRKLNQDELDLITALIDYGITEPTGLFDGELLTTTQVKVQSLDELIKGFEYVARDNILFLNNVLCHEKRTIKLIPTKANPERERIVPEYFVVKWTKLSNNYSEEV